MRLASVLLLTTLCCHAPAWSQEERPSVSMEVSWLVEQLEATSGADTACVATYTSVNLIRNHAWILSAWVEDLPAFGGQYFTLSFVDGERVGELIHGAGEGGVRRIVGDELERYLETVELDAKPLERLFRARYCDPPRPPAKDG